MVAGDAHATRRGEVLPGGSRHAITVGPVTSGEKLYCTPRVSRVGRKSMLAMVHAFDCALTKSIVLGTSLRSIKVAKGSALDPSRLRFE